MRFIPSDQLGVARWECAITGRNTDPEGFFDARRDLTLMGTDNLPREMHVRASVCAAAAKEMARTLGWVSPEEIQKVQEAFDAQTAELQDIRERLDKLSEIERLTAEVAA